MTTENYNNKNDQAKKNQSQENHFSFKQCLQLYKALYLNLFGSNGSADRSSELLSWLGEDKPLCNIWVRLCAILTSSSSDWIDATEFYDKSIVSRDKKQDNLFERKIWIF